jgi:hypothetical protein
VDKQSGTPIKVVCNPLIKNIRKSALAELITQPTVSIISACILVNILHIQKCFNLNTHTLIGSNFMWGKKPIFFTVILSFENHEA